MDNEMERGRQENLQVSIITKGKFCIYHSAPWPSKHIIYKCNICDLLFSHLGRHKQSSFRMNYICIIQKISLSLMDNLLSMILPWTICFPCKVYVT